MKLYKMIYDDIGVGGLIYRGEIGASHREMWGFLIYYK